MKKFLTVFPLLLLLLLPGCGKKTDGGEYYDASFFGMDTYITLRFSRTGADGESLSDEYLKETADRCASLLSDLDLLLSAHNPNSQVYALNQNINMMVSADERLLSVLDTSYTICELTNGAYDPTLGGLSQLWNIQGGGPVPPDSEIMTALLHTGTDKIVRQGNTLSKTDPDTKIDFGGVGKGYATQALLEYLSTTDIPYGLVSLGGNIGVFGAKEEHESYKIGVRDPNDRKGVVGYLYLHSGFVSVSGDYERFFYEGDEKYHHILDPVTGYPAKTGLRSVVCYSTNGAAADALSTALFVLGVEESMKLYEEGTMQFEAVFITEGNQVILTDGLKRDGNFELTNENYTIAGPSESGESANTNTDDEES